MGSSRFPGKMLREIAGKPLIWHVIHRLQQCSRVDQIILATSDRSSDDPLTEYVSSLGITVLRGPEQNVLQRYMLALPLTSADIILRITGDSPLIDPELIDRLLSRLAASNADYAVIGARSSDCGIDPITRRGLLRIAAERGTHPAAIEHVTGYLTVEPDFLPHVAVTEDIEGRYVEGARFSVDTPADLAFMSEIYRRLGVAPGDARFRDVIALLKAEPSLLALNAHIRQRRADEKPIAVLIRCDGGHALGLGHVVRCLAIATVLRDRHAAAVSFAVGGDDAAFAAVRAASFPIRTMTGVAPAAELAALLRELAPDLVLMDLRTPFDAAEIAAIRSSAARLAVLDDPGPRRLEAELGFYPPSAAALDWRGAKGEACIGFEFIPLRAQFSPPPARAPAAPPLALILGGGSDPAGIGQRWLESAARALPLDWQIGLVIGAAAAPDPALDAVAAQLGGRLTLHRNIAAMAELMSQAEMALAAFGMTAYELAVIGTPMLLLCLTEDHHRAALQLAARDAAIVVGIAGDTGDAVLDRAIAELCRDPAKREALSRQARQLIDGEGAKRIADRLAALALQARTPSPALAR